MALHHTASANLIIGGPSVPPMSGLADGQPIPANTVGCQGLRPPLGGQLINLLLWYRFGLPPTTEVVGFRLCIAVSPVRRLRDACGPPLRFVIQQHRSVLACVHTPAIRV